MPHNNLLDPQGKAVLGGLQHLGLDQVQDVRVGKHIQLRTEAADANEARKAAQKACENLLANSVMEKWEIESVEPV